MTSLKDWFRKMFGGSPEFESTDESLPPALRHGSSRERQLAVLQAGYMEVLDLVRGIRGHLEQQSASQDKLLDLMGQISDSASGLKELGKLSEKQIEAMGLIQKQFEQSTEHGRQLVGSLDRFNDTMQGMDRSNRQTATTLTGLVESMRSSETLMREHLERSEKRMMTLVVVLVLLVLGALALVMVPRWAGQKEPVSPVASSVAPASVTEKVTTDPVVGPVPVVPEDEAQPEEVAAPNQGGLSWARSTDDTSVGGVAGEGDDNAVPDEVTDELSEPLDTPIEPTDAPEEASVDDTSDAEVITAPDEAPSAESPDTDQP